MSDALRVYDPDECDAAGVPLDYYECRTCGGTGRVEGDPETIRRMRALGQAPIETVRCYHCGGRGSIREALRWRFRLWTAQQNYEAGRWDEKLRMSVGVPFHNLPTVQINELTDEAVLRCQECKHPEAEGTWEVRPGLSHSPEWGESQIDRWRNDVLLGIIFRELREGKPVGDEEVHYSPCDEGCRHAGPGRASGGGLRDGSVGRWLEKAARYRVQPMPSYAASWRPVDVRTLGWPHDLRPEKLAVLCLRCYAEKR